MFEFSDGEYFIDAHEVYDATRHRNPSEGEQAIRELIEEKNLLKSSAPLFDND